MNAPIIIIPEECVPGTQNCRNTRLSCIFSVTTHQCSHLVIDAGHIAVESDLADKGALREIHAKRNQPYNEDDYKRLESLMYDKMSLKLQAAQVSPHQDSINKSNATNLRVQFVLGNDLQACRDALTSEKSDTLHLLERININLRVQNSIVPSAFNLARFKISGKLPSLQVNVSDAKYKALMRIIDVAIPHFDDSGDQKPPQTHIDTASLALPLSAGLFGPVGTEYNVDDDEADSEGASTHRDDLFFEASDGSFQVFHAYPQSPVFSHVLQHPEIRQHIFELDFEVDNLRGAISKSSSDGKETPLGEVVFQQFRLAFSLLKFNMNVDINLRYVVRSFLCSSR